MQREITFLNWWSSNCYPWNSRKQPLTRWFWHLRSIYSQKRIHLLCQRKREVGKKTKSLRVISVGGLITSHLWFNWDLPQSSQTSYLNATYYRIRERVSSVIAEKKSTQFQIMLNSYSYRSPMKNVHVERILIWQGDSPTATVVFFQFEIPSYSRDFWTTYSKSMLYRMIFHGIEGNILV